MLYVTIKEDTYNLIGAEKFDSWIKQLEVPKGVEMLVNLERPSNVTLYSKTKGLMQFNELLK